MESESSRSWRHVLQLQRNEAVSDAHMLAEQIVVLSEELVRLQDRVKLLEDAVSKLRSTDLQ